MKSSTRWQPDVQPGSINVSITHQSDMWAGGVVILELYAGTLAALRAGKGEHACELLETLLKERNPTPAMDEGLEHESIVWHEGGKDVVRVADENGQRPRSSAGGESDTGTRSRRNMLRVEMPEEVSEILRNIFKEQPERRPPSMEVKTVLIDGRGYVQCDFCVACGFPSHREMFPRWGGHLRTTSMIVGTTQKRDPACVNDFGDVVLLPVVVLR